MSSAYQMNEMIFPFCNINEAYIAMYIYITYKHLDSTHLLSCINHILEKNITINELRIFIDITKHINNFFANDFFINLRRLSSETNMFFVKNDLSTRVFQPNTSSCLNCKSELVMKKKEIYTGIVYLTHKIPEKCTNIAMVCSKCNTKHFHSYHVLSNGNRKFYKNSLSNEFISFGRNTYYELEFLNVATSDIIHKHASFKSICDAHNALYTNPMGNRNQLIELRFIEVWFYWQFINYINDNLDLEIYLFPKMGDLDSYLLNHKKEFFPMFVKRWTGDSHKNNCKHKDCSKILNVDGNWKINRLKCLFDETTVVSGEVKPIKIGCPKTPMRSSYFCHDHHTNEPKLNFTVSGKIISIKISDIVPYGEKLEIKIVHDAFCQPEKPETLLYLCETLINKPKLVWLRTSQIPLERLIEYNSNVNEKTKDEVI